MSLHVFKRLGAPNLFSYWRAPVRVIGSLDTFDLFDLFDSVGREPPKKLLDYMLLSIPSVLVCDLPLDEECNRVTDAPGIDETTLWAHFPSTEQRPDSGAFVTRLKRKGQ